MIPDVQKTLILKQVLVLLGMSAGTFWIGSRLLSPPNPRQTPPHITVVNAAAVASNADPTRTDQALPPHIDAVTLPDSPTLPKPVKRVPIVQSKSRPQVTARISRDIVHIGSSPPQHDNGQHRGWYKHDKPGGDEGDDREGHKGDHQDGEGD